MEFASQEKSKLEFASQKKLNGVCKPRKKQAGVCKPKKITKNPLEFASRKNSKIYRSLQADKSKSKFLELSHSIREFRVQCAKFISVGVT
jgi:hypothetical protein